MVEIEDMMLDMLDRQNKLNILTCGENWIKGYTNKGKRINFKLCIRMETSELIDSFNWKHWKDIENNEIDLNNVKIELTDIFHFILSEYISKYSNKYQLVNFEYVCEKLLNSMYKKLNSKYEVVDVGIRDIVHFAENMITSKSIKSIADNFFIIMRILEINKLFNFTDLYKLYVGKNILNKFRQDNGYKDGTYVKLWKFKNGVVEDNEVMYNIIEDKNLNFNIISIDNFKDIVINKLTTIYEENKTHTE
jgi:hypothetical protein